MQKRVFVQIPDNNQSGGFMKLPREIFGIAKNKAVSYIGGRRVVYDYNEYLGWGGDKRQQSQNDVKRALLSYVVSPLLPPPNKRDRVNFSNAGIAQNIPRVLNELGYTVDIVNYNNVSFVPRKHYDLFIGHAGYNFEKIAKKLDPKIPKIYFSTGIYWKVYNYREQERLRALFQRRGVNLPPDRFITESEEYANEHADGIICLGNDSARETYKRFPKVLNLNNAVFPDEYDIKFKDYEYGRTQFLFFNGPGNVHKGLDLLLDAFSALDQHLYVCQAIEPKFAVAYKKELNECSNIHVVGYLKKKTKEFCALMNKCNFVISLTCAEGQPGSIIECMAHGLIPILSKEANIEVKNFGVMFKENTVEEIIKVVNDVSHKPTKWYEERSRLVHNEISENYSEEKFILNMKNAIQTIFKRKPP